MPYSIIIAASIDPAVSSNTVWYASTHDLNGLWPVSGNTKIMFFDQIDIFVKYRAKATAKLIAPSLYSLSELVHGTTNAIASVFSPRGACIIAYKVLLANPFSWYEICSPESTSHDAITSLRSATPLFHLSNLLSIPANNIPFALPKIRIGLRWH